MSKKSTKVLSGALATSLALGAMPVFADTSVDYDALYAVANEAALKAQKEGTQEAITAARTAIKPLLEAYKSGQEWLGAMVGTLSSMVDEVQQKLFNDFYAMIYDLVDGKPVLKETLTQAEIDEARDYVLGFKTYEGNAEYINTWSAAVDAFQQKKYEVAYAAVEKAEKSQLQEDIDAAQKLMDELATSKNAEVAKWVTTVQAKLDAVVVKLIVESVSAIDANTISVTFEGMEPVEVTLEEALVHGQTEVTFVYEEVEYTAELDEAYADPAVVEFEEALANAEAAIAELPEVITLAEKQDVVDARVLVEAVLALDAEATIEGLDTLVAAEATIAQLEADEEAAAKLAAAIEAADLAISELPETVTLEDVDAIEAARALVQDAMDLGAVEADFEFLVTLETAEDTIDALKAEAEATKAVIAAEASKLQADVDAAMVLVEAVEDGEVKEALVARLAVVQEAINVRVAAEKALKASTEAVVAAEESLLEADLAEAKKLVTALEASDAKVLLSARLDSLQLKLKGIIATVNNAKTEVKLYSALNVKPFVNVDIDNITEYDKELTNRSVKPYATIAEIQTIIDTVNAKTVNDEITELVTTAREAVEEAEKNPTGLVGDAGSKTLIEVAQEEIDKLPTEVPEAVATSLKVNVTVKADLQERLEAVKVVVPVLKARNQIELLAALENNFDRVNEDLIATYETNLLVTDITVAAIQGKIDAANLLAAKNAVNDAETNLTVADVDAAQALVNYLPDLDPNTVKDGLQDRLDVVAALIAVADATTEAELLAALENEVLGLTDVNPAAIAEYKEEIDDNNADITTAANVQVNVVNAGNTAAETAAVADIITNFGTYDETKAEDQAKALKELNRLADVSDLDKETIDAELIEQYILAIVADAGTTIDGTDDPAAIQTLINGENAVKEETLRLAVVNAATDAYEMRTALTAVAIAETDGYLDLTSQEKLEVAELVLVARNAITGTPTTAKKFALTTDVTTAIGTATSDRATFLTNVNGATSISTMVTALDVVEFPGFQELGALEQVEVAELVLNALTELRADDVAPAVSDFETIAEVKAAAGL